ncbi:hypothetical protein EB118_22170 [bacterium]|nr:hypothetical protein [bacterium]NDD84658.1 hypothetical protein [bacterium]NDG32763.1 hypothetical protein [bacterium]
MAIINNANISSEGLRILLDADNNRSYKSKNNLLSWANWVEGSGSITNYNQNGNTSENERVSGTDPWGYSNIVWESRPTGTTDADGGWNTDWFDVDRTKLYRFSVWVKRTSSTSGGTFYFGMYANGSGSRRNDNSIVEGNAYWECTGTGSLTQNQWYLWVGHVYPHDTSYTGKHPDTGYYTTSSGRIGGIGGCNIGSGDLKWNVDTTQGIHRTYHYYCSDSTTRLQFFQPRVDCINGTEPSIADLLNNAGSCWFDISGYNNDFIINSRAFNLLRPRYMDFNGSYGCAVTKSGYDTPYFGTCTAVVWTRIKNSAAEWRTLFRAESSGNDHQVIILASDWIMGMYDNVNGTGFNSTGFSQQSLPGYSSNWNMLVWRWVSTSNDYYYYTFSYNDSPGTIRGYISSSNARFKTGFRTLGAYNSSSPSQFWGDIGYFAFYNRRLDDNEVINLYNATKGRFQ